jgi:hypothetical protein
MKLAYILDVHSDLVSLHRVNVGSVADVSLSIALSLISTLTYTLCGIPRRSIGSLLSILLVLQLLVS